MGVWAEKGLGLLGFLGGGLYFKELFRYRLIFFYITTTLKRIHAFLFK